MTSLPHAKHITSPGICVQHEDSLILIEFHKRNMYLPMLGENEFQGFPKIPYRSENEFKEIYFITNPEHHFASSKK